MALIKCHNCGSDVSSKAEFCPRCNNRINNINTISTNTEEERVINFFIKYATVVKVLSFIGAFFSLIIGLVAMEETDGFSLISGIISAILLIISGIVMENTFKWKSYMLKNTYEINTKTR